MATAELERTAVRELDHRVSDGIDVRLMWNSLSNQVSVAVEDSKSGQAFELDVDGADALEAFHHPYAFGKTAVAGAVETSGFNFDEEVEVTEEAKRDDEDLMAC